MKTFYDYKNTPKYKRPVVALGVFDGVHRGHRKILRAVVAEAEKINGTSIVLTFWPHPQKEKSLYSLQHRLKLIEELGIDVCLIVNFHKNFSRISASDFLTGILIKKLHVQAVCVGENFRFGKDAQGDINSLKQFSKIYNFRLEIFKIIRVKGQSISSTCIRSLIKEGKIRDAEKLLGRPVTVLGTVIRGASLAKQLGFPTANINPHHEVLPAAGVYSVKIIFNGMGKYKTLSQPLKIAHWSYRRRRFSCQRNFMGLCYIGTRPTIITRKPKEIVRIEVHIFGFHQDIYGENLEIQFIKKIRNEKKFNTLELLAKQIKKDVSRAINIPTR